jgi:hypothetical protein
MTTIDRATIARRRYEAVIRDKVGHHCPPWDALPDLMRDHLISLVDLTKPFQSELLDDEHDDRALGLGRILHQ